MELRNLRTFQTVVDQGSYQRAAERLGYTQSTITVQIQQLEGEMGVPLFERVGRRMVLTEAGERILPRARELLEAADQLMECGRKSSAPSGTLRVDMAETLLCYRMQPVIRAFRERAPQVRLVIRSCNCMRIAANVRTGACDLGVGYDMDWNREALEVESLGSYDIVLLASPDFSEPDFTTPGQRKAVSLVTDEPDSIFRRWLEEYLRQREIELDVTLELWSIETIKRCVMSNLGFTYLPPLCRAGGTGDRAAEGAAGPHLRRSRPGPVRVEKRAVDYSGHGAVSGASAGGAGGGRSRHRRCFRSRWGSRLWKGLSIRMMSSPIRWIQSQGM